ncbi:MAG: hypothetical protein HY648_07295 [Acidobacteria bacterium]|nr:hypothetical protein [Acidobacteriota bacterium]
MTGLTSLSGAAALLFLGTALMAQYESTGQQPSRQQPSQQGSSPSQHPTSSQQQGSKDWQWKMGKKATLTGCLTQSTIGALAGTVQKGSSEEFLLKRQGTQQEITVKGLADLDEHKDHMVQLSGTMDREDGKEVFKVSQIKHVANACEDRTGLGKATGKSKDTQSQEPPRRGTETESQQPRRGY